MSERMDRALKLFQQGMHWSQVVLASYGRSHGIDEQTAYRVSRVFGGGMGEGNVCGAVTGALMVIGLAAGSGDPDEETVRAGAHEKVRKFLSRYRESRGTVDCNRLLGDALGVEDGLKEANERQAFFDICPAIIQEAGEILEELEI